MSVLFIAEDWPITPNARGGMSPLIYSHLQAMFESGLNVSLVTLLSVHKSKGFDEFRIRQKEVWDVLREKLYSHEQITIGAISKINSPLRAIKASLKHFPGYPFVPDTNTYRAFSNIVSEVNPNFIWAEDILAAMLAVQIETDCPIVYSHNDWKWRIKWHRGSSKNTSWHKSLKFWLRRWQEERLVRAVAGCVAASASEADEIKSLGVKNVLFFPTIYSPIQFEEPHFEEADVRIVHLGGMHTTANRLGMERFLDVSWPLICQTVSSSPPLWVIGSLEGVSESLLRKLERANATCTGFREDLTTVLRPYDIHIIPWEYNTGTRTRIPLILNHCQVLLSTRAAAACLPELHHEENCILVEDLIQMAQEVITLVNAPDRRQQLAKAGRETFLQQYTQEAIQPRFNKFLQKLNIL